eukprot:gene13908-biopygen18593
MRCPGATGEQGEQDTGTGVARAWRGRGAGYRQFLAWGGAGVAGTWRGHVLSPQGTAPLSNTSENTGKYTAQS